MKQLPKLFIYLSLLFLATLLPSNLQKKPLVAIFKPNYGLLSQTPQHDSTNFSLASKLDTITIPVTQSVSVDATSSGVVSNCGSDYYQQLIYTRESGCDPTKFNSIKCFGLGQDCNGIVYNLCGYDWTCQNNYFTNYMLARYHTWAAGWQHELDYGWW